MTWDQLHKFAEEAELWSTLAINSWLLMTALIVGAKWLNNRKLPTLEIVGKSAIQGVILNIVGAIIAAALGYFVTLLLTHHP